ncbi:MAG: TRAP transporter small permease subunit [Burkholderiales bacterium]|nr:TRAP transporter small permease subunit [Burkholderiales bacterium]
MNAYIRGMDALSRVFGYVASALVLAICLISAGNASIRYTFHMSSNAWLEIQWYLFSATVFFGAPLLVTLNEHVRVDVIYGGRSGRTKAIIDLLGFIFFYMPVCAVMVWASVRFVEQSWLEHEMSNNAGGLLRWPVKALIPAGFGLLILQGIAEIFKRIGYLRGVYNMDTHYERPLQ